MDTLAHCPQWARVFASWVAVDTVYDVYETVTFIYAALSSRWVTTKVATKSIVYYLRFTIDRAITKSLVVACILNGMSSGCIDTKIFYTRSFHWSFRERTVHVLCASNLWLSEFLSNLPYIFHLSRLFFLLLFFSSPLSTFLNAVLAINHLCCTHYCRNFYRCS